MLCGEAALAEFAVRSERLRRSLQIQLERADVAPPGDDAVARAGMVVWLSGAFEVFWCRYLDDLCSAVGRMPLRGRRRRLAAQAIYFVDRLQSVGEGGRVGLTTWRRTIDVFNDVGDLRAARGSFRVPHDGRTVRPEHLAICWALFGLSSPTFPSAVHRTSLDTLATERNQLAHGEVSPETYGRLRTPSDVLGVAQRLEDLVEHCVLASRVLGA